MAERKSGSLYVLILASICGYVSCLCCMDGWTWYEGSCYYFPPNKVKFVDAEEVCQQLGGHVAHIETPAENNFLKSFASQLHGADHWVGLTDNSTEGEWVWYDTDTMASFTDWHKGQPDGDVNANCVVLDHRSHQMWADRNCSGLHKPMCEIRMGTSTVVVG